MAAQPAIIKAASRFKAELLRENDKALRQMVRAYGETWKSLHGQLRQVTKLIAEADAQGKIPVIRAPGSNIPLAENEYSANWLFRQARYQELMYQTEVDLLAFSKQAAAMVGRQQDFGLQAGQQHALGILRASRIRTTWNQLPKEALKDLVGFLADGSPLEYKFAQMAPAVAEQIKAMFAAGLAQGWNPRKIAAEIHREHQGALRNSLLTCRTECLRAYRTASHDTYEANSDVVDGWIWSAGHSPRTCLGCWSRDGELHPLSDRLVDHPGGRCCEIPHTKSWQELGFPGIQETGAQPWNPETHFKRMSEADQFKVMGPGRFELWKDGKVSLRDMGRIQRSAVWGSHWRPATLKELTGQVPGAPTLRVLE